MRSFSVRRASRVQGKLILSGDKSVACRSVILSSVASGKTTIRNFPVHDDSLSALNLFRSLGVRISVSGSEVTVFGRGLRGLLRPEGGRPVFVGDSGTTMRLALGVLAGQDFGVTLTSGKSLSLRPMLRVTRPLRLMGASIKARRSKGEEYPPLSIRGGDLKAITYTMPVASAQVKSAILLAGLYAAGTTRVVEPEKSRDHTERMLRRFKARVSVRGRTVSVKGAGELVSPGTLIIPGDISSAGFFLVLAAILKGSRLLIRNVGLNPSRLGALRVLQRMSCRIRVQDRGLRVTGYEPAGDIAVEASALTGTVVRKTEIPSLIDELPILMVAACFARGRTIFKGVGELRVKETDRIRSMSLNLSRMGGVVRLAGLGRSEDIVVEGVGGLRGCRVKSFGDHRTAMSMVVAGLCAEGETVVDDVACISKSFPGFLGLIKAIVR